MDHFRFLGIELGLACNGGSWGRGGGAGGGGEGGGGGISLKRDLCHFNLKRLPPLASVTSQYREYENDSDENDLYFFFEREAILPQVIINMIVTLLPGSMQG